VADRKPQLKENMAVQMITWFDCTAAPANHPRDIFASIGVEISALLQFVTGPSTANWQDWDLQNKLYLLFLGRLIICSSVQA
jgi:hypothetical protein